MISSAFEVYRKDGPNFYPIKADNEPYSDEPIQTFEGRNGLESAANAAIEFCSTTARPMRDGEIILVRNVDGGIGAFRAVIAARAERTELS
jgi:hypothetical protein